MLKPATPCESLMASDVAKHENGGSAPESKSPAAVGAVLVDIAAVPVPFYLHRPNYGGVVEGSFSSVSKLISATKY